MRIYDAGIAGTAFQGRIIISREFFNPDTRDFIHIEAHEMVEEGQFTVAFWVPDGNDGGHGFDGSLRHVVQHIQAYTPSAGFVEMPIPEDAYG